MFLPLIVICTPAYCLAWNAPPVTNLEQCQVVVLEQRETARALVHEGWVYAYECRPFD